MSVLSYLPLSVFYVLYACGHVVVRSFLSLLRDRPRSAWALLFAPPRMLYRL